MNCRNCKKELREDDVFCPKCGVKIEKENCKGEVNTYSYGINSPNIGNGNGNVNNIENLNINSIEKNEERIIIKKEICDSVMKEKTLKRIKFVPFIISLAGFISSVITIVESKTIFNPLFNIFTITGVIFLSIFLLLSIAVKKLLEQEFIFIKIFWWLPSLMFLVDENKLVRRIKKLKGKCNICDGNLFFYKDDNTGDVIGVCKKNNNHRFRLDHTSFIGEKI